MISVCIVAGIRLYRDGLAHALCRRADVRVVGTGTTPADLARADAAPDVVLLEDAGGPPAVEAVRTTFPAAAVVALGVPATDREIVAYAEAGVAGFLDPDASLDELVSCIRHVAGGDVLCSPRIAGVLLRHVQELAHGLPAAARTEALLTARQAEIVRLIDEGLSNKEIALRLRIELSTVKNHVHQILEKLGVDRRSEAVARLRMPLGLSVGIGELAPVFAMAPGI